MKITTSTAGATTAKCECDTGDSPGTQSCDFDGSGSCSGLCPPQHVCRTQGEGDDQYCTCEYDD